MTTCLKYLVPISCFLFLASTLWSLALPGRSLFGLRSRVLGNQWQISAPADVRPATRSAPEAANSARAADGDPATLVAAEGAN